MGHYDRTVTDLKECGFAGTDNRGQQSAGITEWQAHSIRGAIAGSLKRKGYVVTSERVNKHRSLTPIGSET